MWTRVVAGILGTIALLAGIIAYGYANLASDNFGSPGIDMLGTGLMWLLTLGGFVMGLHFLKYCITGKFFQVNQWARALILGALSFFPGLIVSAIPATLLVSKRWPRDIHADNIAMLTCSLFGAAAAVTVFIALIRSDH